MRLIKKTILFSITILISNSNIFAQSDSLYDNPKSGWIATPLPYVTFDSDLGYEIGLVSPIYNFGDGSIYPDYRDAINFSASVFTKGSAFLFTSYESNYLINNIRFYVDFGYIPDLKYDFYGLNGYESNYEKDWINNGSPNYKTSVFYKTYRQLFRLRINLEGKTPLENLNWFLGAGYYNISIYNVPIEFFNTGKSGDKTIPSLTDEPTLYNKYTEWGIIPENEVNGGSFTNLRFGLVYDTRDNKANAMKGFWDEAILIYAPNFLASQNKDFVKLSLVHRHYITLIPKKVSLAYRLSYAGTISGYTPTYAQTFTYHTRANGVYNEGYGGAKTIRGVLRNRVVADGVASINTEIRWKVVKFKAFNQNIHLTLSSFFDSAKITKKINITDALNNSGIDNITKNKYFDIGADGFHNTYGGGIHLVVNENAIIAMDYGVTLDKRDGDHGLYIGAYFLF